MYFFFSLSQQLYVIRTVVILDLYINQKMQKVYLIAEIHIWHSFICVAQLEFKSK